MRRAWMLLIVVFVVFGSAPRAAADPSVTITITNGVPSPNPAKVDFGGTVTWTTNDVGTTYKVTIQGGGSLVVSNKDPASQSGVTQSLQYTIENPNQFFAVQVVNAPPPTSQQPVTVPPTVAPATTTTTTPTTVAPPTSDTTPATDQTTTTSTTEPSTTTTLVASESGLIPIADSSGSGGSSALPWLAAGSVVVAGLAGFVYYLWWRSGEVPKDLAEQPEAPPAS